MLSFSFCLSIYPLLNQGRVIFWCLVDLLLCFARVFACLCTSWNQGWVSTWFPVVLVCLSVLFSCLLVLRATSEGSVLDFFVAPYLYLFVCS